MMGNQRPENPEAIGEPQTPAKRPRKPWPWWLALFDFLAIWFSSGILVVGLAQAMGASIVDLVFPQIYPSERAFALYALELNTWPMVVTWFLVSWVRWKGAVTEMLPLGPIKVPLSKALIVVVLAVAIVLGGEFLLVQMGLESIRKDGLYFAYFMHSPMAAFVLTGGVLAAPAAEELMFRGFLQSALSTTRLGFWGSATIISLMFGMLHPYSWPGSLLVAAIGIVFSLVLRITGSLRPCILTHATVNLILLLVTAATPYQAG